MRSIKVKDYMTDYVLSFSPETELFKAIKALRQRGVSSAPVIDKEGTLVGVLAQWDCLGRMLHGSYFEEVGGSVQDFMMTDLITTSPAAGIVDVADAMLERQWHYCIPVLDGSKMAGVLSYSDILQMVYDFESGKNPS